MPDVYGHQQSSSCSPGDSTHSGEIDQQLLYRRQHFHHPLYHLTPSVAQTDIMHAGHVESYLRLQMGDDGVAYGWI